MMNETDSPMMKLIIQGGTALPAGFLAASLQSWHPGGFTFSWMTALIFIAAMGTMIAYWQLIFSEQFKFAKFAASGLVAALSILGFLYPLRFVAPNKYPEIMTGLITATIALSGVATFLWCCRYLFEEKAESSSTS